MTSPPMTSLLASELFSVKGKIALVTGGGSGIGLMCAQALAANGARVYIVGRRKAKLDNAVLSHSQGAQALAGGELIPLVADITSKASIAALVAELAAREPRLDILINNAGVQEASTVQNVSSLPAALTSSAEELRRRFFSDEVHTFEDWDRVYRSNASALFFVTMAFLPLLQAASEPRPGVVATTASVINVSSIAGLMRFSCDTFAYHTSKGAAVHLTKLLSSEITTARLKIRVNGIAPGVFPSEMQTGDAGIDGKSVVKDEEYGHLPAGRMGNEMDIGAAVLFVATCQYLWGQIIAVDGGYLIRGDK